jgi:hypothetical protein
MRRIFYCLLACVCATQIACTENVTVVSELPLTISPGVAPGESDGCAGDEIPEGRLRGLVYDIPLDTRLLPDFSTLSPVESVCLDRLDMTPRRSIYPGFPGLKDRFRWFAVELEGTFVVDTPGLFYFRLTSDDGSQLTLDGAMVVDNDGYHPRASPRAAPGSPQACTTFASSTGKARGRWRWSSRSRDPASNTRSSASIVRSKGRRDRVTPTVRERAWRLALFLAAAASAVPLWCAHHLPLADLPQHVAAIGMLRHWWDPALHLDTRYALNLGDSQYFSYHAAGAALSLVTGSAESANRVLMTGTAFAFPYALRSLLSALDRDRRLALLGAPAFWSAPLMMGFVTYVAAVPVATWAIALFVRELREPSRPRAIGLACLSCVLFSLHLSAYLVFLGSAALLASVLHRRPARIARALAWVAPSAVLTGAWALRGSLAMPATPKLEGQIAWTSTRTLAQQLPVWAHDIWRTHVDEACAIVLAVALIALALQRGRAPEDRWLARAAWAPLLVAGLAYWVLPYNIGAAVMLDVRMATFVILFAPLVLAPRPGLAGALPLLAVLASHGIGVADSVIEVRRAESEELGDVDRLIDRIPPGASVLTLPVHLTSRHTHWPPWVFLGSYHLAEAGGAAEMSFTRIRHWPLRDQPGSGDTQRPLFWTLAPCTFRNAFDGPRYDYLLVRASRDIFRAHPPGPAWQRLDQEREWSLYQREAGSSWPAWSDRVDPGPCVKDDESEPQPAVGDE